MPRLLRLPTEICEGLNGTTNCTKVAKITRISKNRKIRKICSKVNITCYLRGSSFETILNAKKNLRQAWKGRSNMIGVRTRTAFDAHLHGH